MGPDRTGGREGTICDVSTVAEGMGEGINIFQRDV